MILISHRGNTKGNNSSTSNSPEVISSLLNQGVHCEVDVWRVSDKFFLGHDYAQYEVDEKFLKVKDLWCHAKNLPALESLLYHGVHCFWHETDRFTITSKGYIWTFPEEEVTKNSVIVHKGSDWKEKNYNCAAVCTDYIL